MKFLFLSFILFISSFVFNQDLKETQEQFPKYGIGFNYGPGFGSALEDVVDWPTIFPPYNYYSSLGSSFSVGVHTDMLFKK